MSAFATTHIHNTERVLLMSKLKGDLLKSTSGRTPYEVRLEVLRLAQHIAEDKAERQLQYLHTQNDIAHNFLHRDYEEGVTSDRAQELVQTAKANIDQMSMPQMGVEEVLKIAKKLNKFISEG